MQAMEACILGVAAGDIALFV